MRGPGTRLCCRTAAPEGRRARHVRARDRTDLPCPEHTRAVGRVRLGCGWWARFGGWVRHAVTPNPSQVGSVPCGRGCRPRAREDHAPGGLWLPRRRRTGPPQCRRRQPCDRERAVRGGRARARRVRRARAGRTRAARGHRPGPAPGPAWCVVVGESHAVGARGAESARAAACNFAAHLAGFARLGEDQSPRGAQDCFLFLSADPRKKVP